MKELMIYEYDTQNNMTLAAVLKLHNKNLYCARLVHMPFWIAMK